MRYGGVQGARCFVSGGRDVGVHRRPRTPERIHFRFDVCAAPLPPSGGTRSFFFQRCLFSPFFSVCPLAQSARAPLDAVDACGQSQRPYTDRMSFGHMKKSEKKQRANGKWPLRERREKGGVDQTGDRFFVCHSVRSPHRGAKRKKHREGKKATETPAASKRRLCETDKRRGENRGKRHPTTVHARPATVHRPIGGARRATP